MKINVLWNTLKMYSRVITMCCITKPVYLKIYSLLWEEIAGGEFYFFFPRNLNEKLHFRVTAPFITHSIKNC